MITENDRSKSITVSIGNSFRLEEYTPKEHDLIFDFMHQDFPHASFEGGRHAKIVVEYPPAYICKKGEWRRLLKKVLIPEVKDFHPLLRKKPITVRLVDFLYDETTGLEAGGNALLHKSGECLVRVSYMAKTGRLLGKDALLYVLMHEVCEADFWFKSPKKKNQIISPDRDQPSAFMNEETYDNLLDEKIANRRALRALERVWTKSDFRFVLPEYEEDRE